MSDLTPAQKLALKSEITTDPVSLGYAAVAGDHVAIMKILNKDQRQIDDDGDKPTWQLFRCFDDVELTAVEANAAKFRRLQVLCSLSSVNPSSARLRKSIVFVFGNPSATLTTFDGWAKRSGSRAEELGFGRVTESDVADALLRT